MDKEITNIIKAGKICSDVKKWVISNSLVIKGVPLIDIAEKIENKIIELGGKPAFPVNTSINEVAAHYTPYFDDKSIAHGLIKIDFGVHVDGWAADNAISFDLENSQENKKLIESASKALATAIEIVQNKKDKTSTFELGSVIQSSIQEDGFIPIINLSGHSIDHFDLHSGITIPNISQKSSSQQLDDGLFAIEPFVTLSSASGRVYDGKPSGIYQIKNLKNVRSPTAREILNYINEEYGTLPFCSRWLYKKFGSKAFIALKELESNGIVHQYDQLIESSKCKVAQAEHTILINEGKVIITTE
ncbi:type II methionyl aminopeptidase [Candidatus Pacearchaeota archaeon CG10_big_fil_rev_8_21_14_0_10_32_14]|nr:MAG: type II methionyl aminopeptidase [Candidatus Pacearchaeota archaeon CG10_big_fil_rev_8_21_14_0_10_32_14]